MTASRPIASPSAARYISISRSTPTWTPARTPTAAYFYVDDADALRAEWMAAGVDGRFAGIEDTDYGLRESAHVDPDGNLLRYGSWLDGPPETE